VTTAKRMPAVPHLPRSRRPASRVRRLLMVWVICAAKTPPEIIRKMHADTVAALNDQATRNGFEQLGVLVVGSTPEQLASFLKAEMDKWAPVIREAGISIRE